MILTPLIAFQKLTTNFDMVESSGKSAKRDREERKKRKEEEKAKEKAEQEAKEEARKKEQGK